MPYCQIDRACQWAKNNRPSPVLVLDRVVLRSAAVEFQLPARSGNQSGCLQRILDHLMNCATTATDCGSSLWDRSACDSIATKYSSSAWAQWAQYVATRSMFGQLQYSIIWKCCIQRSPISLRAIVNSFRQFKPAIACVIAQASTQAGKRVCHPSLGNSSHLVYANKSLLVLKSIRRSDSPDIFFLISLIEQDHWRKPPWVHQKIHLKKSSSILVMEEIYTSW